jgi:curved DNA-binding protein
MPNPRGETGDLYVGLKVMVPARPSPRERELFEELAKVSTFDPRKRR